MGRRIACLAVAVVLGLGLGRPASAGEAKRTPITRVEQRQHHRLVVHRRRHRVVRAARKMLGVRYVWGGVGRHGIDCSGLTRHIYEKVGVHLPHLAAAQERLGHHVRRLRPGDLLFFYNGGHVGVYVGKGRYIAASSYAGRVKVSVLRGYDTARRLIG